MNPVDMGRHYDERSPIEAEFRDGQVHMYYWYDREDQATLPEAIERISRKVTDTLGLRAGEHLLDAGCGPGKTGVALARQLGVRVTGVTVSAFEVEKANQRAEANGVGGLARFELGDFMRLSYPDGTFDAVLALESLQNATDLDQVLRELYRVLRPGGRLTLSDFSRESDSDPRRLATFMASIKLTALPSLAEWTERVRAAGFEVEEYTQCGPRVYGRKAKFLEAATARRAEVVAKFGEDAVASFSRNTIGFFAARSDQVGYVIVSARKPYAR
ncbi:ubiquinone/menaquinone biosynthesis C-methylase UbiE [Micromonospora profundi]|uniref:class I SAM-dependent methyltransferase n=1 Tax=Micromonospora profundi TaxID=1420889 RepID=UPI00143BD241|nr:class I SAM-dependent methyltransferase [Micromonospora profundi]NJC11479.1 ubiquinone/menaquinone biosynthesis C-methylase UbiE [Micromonospora profundi]